MATEKPIISNHFYFITLIGKGYGMTALKTSLKIYRENANMKQSELAELVGVQRQTIVHLT